jgi:hypothetical protein
MIEEIKESELIELIGKDRYVEFVEDSYRNILNSDEYKDTKIGECVYSVASVRMSNDKYFHCESSLIKNSNGDDFGFTRMFITDDVDFVLDRRIEIKEQIKND